MFPASSSPWYIPSKWQFYLNSLIWVISFSPLILTMWNGYYSPYSIWQVATKTQTTSSIACQSPASDPSMPQAHFILLSNQVTLLSHSVKRSSENCLCLLGDPQILRTPRHVGAKSKTKRKPHKNKRLLPCSPAFSSRQGQWGRQGHAWTSPAMERCLVEQLGLYELVHHEAGIL